MYLRTSGRRDLTAGQTYYIMGALPIIEANLSFISNLLIFYP